MQCTPGTSPTKLLILPTWLVKSRVDTWAVPCTQVPQICDSKNPKWVPRAMLLTTLVLLSTITANVLHATFGRAHGMALCRKWSTELKLPTDDTDRAAVVVRARMALEHPSAFLVAACDPDDSLCAYVCTPVGREVHRIDAVVWAQDTDVLRPALRFRALRRWHGETYPHLCLTPGSTLSKEELWAWNRSAA